MGLNEAGAHKKMKPQIGVVPEYDTALLCAHLSDDLKKDGIFLEQCSDFEKIERFAADIKKPGILPILSPTDNDFFETNCFWLLARARERDADPEQKGRPVGMIGMRRDQSGRESLKSYSERKLRALFPTEANVAIRPDRLPSFANDIKGDIVYMGDLYFSSERRSALVKRENMRKFATIAYSLIYLKWSDLDWIYAFIRDEDASRSALWLYRARHSGSFAHSWSQGPSVDEFPHWLLASEKPDLEELILGEIGHLKRKGVI